MFHFVFWKRAISFISKDQSLWLLNLTLWRLKEHFNFIFHRFNSFEPIHSHLSGLTYLVWRNIVTYGSKYLFTTAFHLKVELVKSGDHRGQNIMSDALFFMQKNFVNFFLLDENRGYSGFWPQLTLDVNQNDGDSGLFLMWIKFCNWNFLIGGQILGVEVFGLWWPLVTSEVKPTPGALTYFWCWTTFVKRHFYRK